MPPRAMTTSLYGLLAAALPLLGTSHWNNFEINLDLPPRQRWRHVASTIRDDYLLFIEGWGKFVETGVNSSLRRQWLAYQRMDKEYEEEVRGLMEALADPRVTMDRMMLFNVMYELNFPKFCSAVLAVDRHGTVFHGRNLDYSLPFMQVMGPGGKARSLKVFANVTFARHGRPAYNTFTIVGFMGIHTGIKLTGHRWSFQQNAHEDSDQRANLQALVGGGQPYMIFARRLMDEDVDFKTAVRRAETTAFCAPQYFAFAGQRPWEGASLEVHRRSAARLSDFRLTQELSPLLGRWYLVQTNDRMWGPPHDLRRPSGQLMLNSVKPSGINEETMVRIMRTPPLLNPLTLFSYVTCPATGRIRIFDRDSSPVKPVKVASLMLRSRASQKPLGIFPEDSAPVKPAKTAPVMPGRRAPQKALRIVAEDSSPVKSAKTAPTTLGRRASRKAQRSAF